ncbi:hypothetical protein ACFWVF_19165 [Streptomyces sp. NPDC058659]|uniref:hypothetical protein n=1 Tax=Streptomyces sp. NPDC058659 TaxID=3346581 RepID=UPI003653E7D3
MPGTYRWLQRLAHALPGLAGSCPRLAVGAQGQCKAVDPAAPAPTLDGDRGADRGQIGLVDHLRVECLQVSMIDVPKKPTVSVRWR